VDKIEDEPEEEIVEIQDEGIENSDENDEEKTKADDKSIVKITIEEARKIVPGIKTGETIETEVTPKDFGRWLNKSTPAT
jgi:hypothetical protein